MPKFWKITLPPLAVFCVAFAVYAFTAQTGVCWQDSGMYQFRVREGIYLSGEYGIASSHPLYIVICRMFAKLAPFLSVCRIVNLTSAFFGALSLSALFVLVRRLAMTALPAVAACAALGFSHMFWWLSCYAEVYTMSTVLLLLEMLAFESFCRTRHGKWAVAGFAAAGAHLAVHNFALLALPFYAIAVLALTAPGSRIKTALCCAGVWIAAATPLWIIAAQFCAENGGDLALTIKSLLFGSGWTDSVLGKIPTSRSVTLANFAIAAFSFAAPAWWLYAPRGFAGFSRSPFLRLLLAATIIHFVFWARYFVPDQSTFILPTLTLLAVWLGIGAARAPSRAGLVAVSAVGIALAIAAPLAAVWLIETGAVSTPAKRQLAQRNEARYWLLPWKHNENSADLFVADLKKLMKPGDALLADSTAASAILAAGLPKAGGWKLYRDRAQYRDLKSVLGESAKCYTISAEPHYAIDREILRREVRPAPPVLEIVK